MDKELLEHVYAWMEEIENRIWELGLQKHFELLPDKFIGCDPRGTILIYLSYLIIDSCDCEWIYSPKKLAELLKNVADAILECTA